MGAVSIVNNKYITPPGGGGILDLVLVGTNSNIFLDVFEYILHPELAAILETQYVLTKDCPNAL